MVKEKNIWISILLSIVTCGLYEIYWICTINNDIDTITNNDHPRNPILVIILSIVTCGLYTIYWSYLNGKLLKELGERTGKIVTSNEILNIILCILCGFVNLIIWQFDINKFADTISDNVI